MTGVTIREKDNTQEFENEWEEAIHQALTGIGIEAERFAKEDPTMPVDTGRARNSITYALSGEETHVKRYTGDKGEEGGEYNGVAEGQKNEAVYIGSNVEYFPFIEEGSQHIQARHVLRRAATEHKKHYQDIMEAALKGENVPS